MSNTNQVLVPSAKHALSNLKLEIANEIGLHDYDKIDKGNLTSRENGYVGGFMVKRMVEDYENRIANR